jgi:hypothetical protein
MNEAPISRASTVGLQGKAAALVARQHAHVNAAAVADIWLMSACDDAIVSAGSTFSRVAYALSGVRAKYVNWRNVCARRERAEPCVFKVTMLCSMAV